MAHRNLTYFEARQELIVPTRNSYSILEHTEEFMTIQESYAEAVKRRSHSEGSINRSNNNKKPANEKQKAQLEVEEPARKRKAADRKPKEQKPETTSMEQHLELRKRWEEKMKVIAEQREAYKQMANETFKSLTTAPSFWTHNTDTAPIANTKNTHLYPEVTENLITLDSLNGFLQKKKKKSAPGTDRITYSMLRQLNTETKLKVIEELNTFYKTGHLPNHLKEVKIIPILKAGRDPNDCSAYRPIAMIPTLTKAINGNVLTKIKKHVHEKQLLPKLSFGFQPEKSTEDCIEYATNFIMDSKRTGQVCVGVFFDFSNAFNTVVVQKLLAVMEEMDFAVDITRWITNFLHNRTLILQSEEGRVEMIAEQGLPQGDVLSPMLFNLYTAKLHDAVQEGVVTIQFADDFLKIIKGKTRDEAVAKAQIEIDHFASKCTDLHLQLNETKTKAILFTAANIDLILKVGEIAIETVRNYKYLGIYIDKNLTYGTHIRTMRDKISDRQNMLKIIGSIKNGATLKVMTMFHKALYGNYILYGSSIYGGASKSYQNMLEVSNRQCQRIATGCTKTTPINTLAALSNEKPLFLIREYHTKKRMVQHIRRHDPIGEQLQKLAATKDTVQSDKCTYMEKIFLENLDQLLSVYPNQQNKIHETKIAIETVIDGMPHSKQNLAATVIRQITNDMIRRKYTHCKHIYTDASRSDTSCSIGVFFEENGTEISMKLENRCCIMTAEILAIWIASKEASTTKHSKTVILTDSQSACWYLINQANLESVDQISYEIFKNMSKKHISLQWIPAHVGVEGNERADELAKLGLNNPAVVRNKLLWHDLVCEFRTQLNISTNDWYRRITLEDGKGRKFFEIVENYPEKPWYWNYQLNGKDIRLLNRIIAGYDYSNFWLAKLKLQESEECDICEELDTTEHALLWCIKYGHVRNFDWEIYRNLKELMGELEEEKLKEIVKFLKMARLKP
ncbi:uncharacterized protein LOC131679982 [Topomyia yanbarensis]|uniref:uncharacterized protein LOC131679982 n=1 Tax=Topomyia yanbarensis TaxID=2498891 RepID=UPI00273BE275|nr:uncharacterized protein LOC131679982 [Topomyia yanbarensis]